MSCQNVIDYDVYAESRLLRTVVRGMKINAEDPLKHRRDASDMELMARRLLQVER